MFHVKHIGCPRSPLNPLRPLYQGKHCPMGQPGDTTRSTEEWRHLRHSNYYVTLRPMAPKTPAPPDAAVEVYVTEGHDGAHNVALRFTTLNSSYVIAVPPHVATDLATQLPTLLEAAAAEATRHNTTPKLTLPTPAERQLFTHGKRD